MTHNDLRCTNNHFLLLHLLACISLRIPWVKYAQSVFESTLALLKSHAESARSLLEQWEQQAQKQPGDPKAAETYVGFFRAPLAAYQRALEAVETASRQSLESFQTATESLQKAMQQGREQWQEAARQAQRSTGKPEK